jgi:hypothetical protein
MLQRRGHLGSPIQPIVTIPANLFQDNLSAMLRSSNDKPSEPAKRQKTLFSMLGEFERQTWELLVRSASSSCRELSPLCDDSPCIAVYCASRAGVTRTADPSGQASCAQPVAAADASAPANAAARSISPEPAMPLPLGPLIVEDVQASQPKGMDAAKCCKANHSNPVVSTTAIAGWLSKAQFAWARRVGTATSGHAMIQCIWCLSEVDIRNLDPRTEGFASVHGAVCTNEYELTRHANGKL